ncbi:MAG: hypothetical protein HYY40_01155 [Bacteroidetes bacterium]|nr:hypothetical protein [Bacteroidota bacterium]
MKEERTANRVARPANPDSPDIYRDGRAGGALPPKATPEAGKRAGTPLYVRVTYTALPLSAVSVRQYRRLQSRLLQCMDYSIPPCGLLQFGALPPPVRDFHPLGHSFKELYLPFRAHTRVLRQAG